MTTNPVLSALDAKQSAGADQQTAINYLPAIGATDDEVAAIIRDAAEAAHAEWSQYAGHWSGDAWQLGRITQDVKTKLGQAFVKGDVVLVRFESRLGGGYDATAYSVRNGIDTAVGYAVAPLHGWSTARF